MANIDRDLPTVGPQTMQNQVNSSLFQQELLSALAVTTAVLALFLSSIGLYGVLSFVVTQRTREMGTGIAIGATKGNLANFVLCRLAGLAEAGIEASIPLAWIGIRLLSQEKLSGSPILLFAWSAILLLSVCGLAGALPVFRAVSVDLMLAVRAE